MYYNDCVRVQLQGGLSSPLWFTRGVKQGCALSPMLFAIYMESLVAVVDSTNLGIKFGDRCLTAMFFADDLILISKDTSFENSVQVPSRYEHDTCH